jgi:hypothetical protein
MTKTELESKPLSDLHQLAAAAGVERYRMLSRAELVERLSDGDDGGSASGAGSDNGEERSERPRRRRGSSRRSGSGSGSSGREREERTDVEEEEEEPAAPGRRSRSRKAPAKKAADESAAKDSDDQDSEDEDDAKPRRRTRRRRRFGRRRDGLALQDLLLPAESGRQAVLLAETREGATELLRGVATEMAGAAEGPDPVALLIDPSPEELADWKREAPQAELVSAGQARHANDALAAAQRRAADGEDVILLVDSLTRLSEGFGDTETAKELFDAGRSDAAKGKGKGSLTVVVALERS